MPLVNSIFPPHAFESAWLRANAKTLGNCDSQLLEKSLHALTLLGHLQESALPFFFRGGTSLLLHLPKIHRLSIDVDIVCPVEGNELVSILAEVSKKPPFTGFEESLRDGTRLPRRRHFKFFYKTTLGIQGYAPATPTGATS